MTIFSKKFPNKIFLAKTGCADVRAHVPTLKVIYARIRTHISENFPIPICTKIAVHARGRARTHARTLKVCKLHMGDINYGTEIWYTIPTQGRNHREKFDATQPIVGRLFSCSAFLLYYIVSRSSQRWRQTCT